MIIIETCPKCGHDLVDTIICTNPPIPKKTCPCCGWSWTGESEQVVRVPFGGNSYIPDNGYGYNPIQTSNFGFQSDPCANCKNNPKNGGSGICLCTLGLPDIRC